MGVSADILERRELSYTICEAVAEQTETDICELPPLYETIDPEALGAVLWCSNDADSHPERSVEFSYCGYRVTIDSTGQVQLHPETESKAAST